MTSLVLTQRVRNAAVGGTYKILQGRLARLIDTLQKVEDEMSVTIDNGHANVLIGVMLNKLVMVSNQSGKQC
jgi:hypothetical protein